MTRYNKDQVKSQVITWKKWTAFFVCLNIIKVVIKGITPPNTIQLIFERENKNKQPVIYVDSKTIHALAHIPICQAYQYMTDVEICIYWFVRFTCVRNLLYLHVQIRHSISYFSLDIIPTVLFWTFWLWVSLLVSQMSDWSSTRVPGHV